MGRRPNAVVQEFFFRGEKLNDSSNRYSHTCKRCGELFPKGRVDGLMGHLVRACPNISPEDRTFVYQATQHHHPEPRRLGAGDADFQSGSQDGMGFAVSHGPSSGQSALDTLAEVSRQHLDHSSRHHSPELAQDRSFIDDGRAIAEQALLAQLQNTTGVPVTVNSNDHAQTGAYQLSDDLANPVAHELSGSVANVDLRPPHSMHAASAASERLDSADARPQDAGMIDPQLGAIEMQLAAHLGEDRPTSEAMSMMWHDPDVTEPQKFGDPPPALLPNDSHSTFEPLQRLNKSRVRGRFSDTRRKEVQEIRKRGACIRCRMLKKPCSEGTPCKTCRAVESARLWKGTCLRTRLADEFTLWSTGLFHSKARIEVPAAVHGMQQTVLAGRIDAAFFRDPTWCMGFAVRLYTSPQAPLDTALATKKESVLTSEPRQEADWSAEFEKQEANSQGSYSTSESIMLLDEGEGMTVKIEEYVNLIALSDTWQTATPFMKATLECALKIIRQEEASVNDATESHASRPCYNLQNQLLKSVVELWLETSILAFRGKDSIRLRYNKSREPCLHPDIAIWDDLDQEERFEKALAPRSAELIHAQLLAATETRCLALGRNVINELERRLLQRQQVSRFSTFLSAVILLNCIERMTGVYKSFDVSRISTDTDTHGEDISTTEQNETNRLIESRTELSRPPHWPLNSAPQRLWPQGEQFADLLIMLLRMRGLPPKTKSTSEDKLIVDQESSLSMGINGRPLKDADGDQVALLAAWLDPMALDASYLIDARDSPLLEHEQPVIAWDMKFIARVLLPSPPG